MTGDRQPDTEPRTTTSRRRVLTAAALTPVLAGAGMADFHHSPHPPAPDELIKPVHTTESDWTDVGEVLRGKGRIAGNTVYRIGFPRRDLKVSSYGVALDPNLGIGSYISFIRYADDQTMLMGDMAVTDGELQRVTDAVHAHGLSQTAIHKHLLSHEPNIWWTHIHGIGPDPAVLARGLRAVLRATATPAWSELKRHEVDLDTESITDAFGGIRGGTEGKIYKVTFARRETITEHGRVLPKGSGATTALAFQALGNGRAAANGDFVLLAEEVQHVIKALRRGGIKVVSLHSHFLREEPRLFYLHFWGVDDGVRLARALSAAVDHTNVTPSGASDL